MYTCFSLILRTRVEDLDIVEAVVEKVSRTTEFLIELLAVCIGTYAGGTCETVPGSVGRRSGGRAPETSCYIFGFHHVHTAPRPRWRAMLVLALSRAWLYVFLLLSPALPSAISGKLGTRELTALPATAIASLVETPDPVRNIDPANPSSHLSRILIPRPPDTPNNTLVKDYLVASLKKLNWHVEEDSFTDTTPYGEKRFTNVIATKDPSAPRRVIVAAHFDSKFFPTYPQSQVRPHSLAVW